MDSGSSPSGPWSLDSTGARLSSQNLSAHIDIARPELGLRELKLKGHQLPGQILATRKVAAENDPLPAWPLPLADSYARGNDFIATYRSIDAWPYAPQLYWTSDNSGDSTCQLAALSLLISVQTHLLDTWPEIVIESSLPSVELLSISSGGNAQPLAAGSSLQPASSPGCILYRLADAPFSYFEMMPVSDYRRIAITTGEHSATRAAWHVFADFLEKGVIRRARLFSAFVPRENDVQLAHKFAAELSQRPLPLTA